ncbi:MULTISPECIES: sensor domain-containing diguanylate cyclase [Gammaproteobacteria]|nr:MULTISPECIES: diguanylate cyclase [Gammaproteobacteria]KAA8982925.1 GGDEF domain-containing protein [Halospina sp. K52047b]
MKRIVGTWFAVVILVLMVLGSGPAAALELVEVDDERELDLSADMRWVADPNSELSAQSLLQAPGEPDWQTTNGRILNLGLESAPVWMGVWLKSSSEIDRYLQIGYPPLDDVRIQLLRASDGETVTEVHTGDTLPFSSRPIAHHDFVSRLTLAPDTRYLLLIRIQTEGALQAPVRLWEPEAFLRDTQVSSALHMMFFGIMGALAIYNLLLYFAVRDGAYLWYVLYLLAFVLSQAALRGFGFQYLWPGAPWFNGISLTVLLSLSLAAVGFFTHQFLNAPRHSRLWSIIFRAIGWSGIALAIISVLVPYHIAIALMLGVVSSEAVLALVGACYLWWRGEVLARFYVIAWGIFLFANIAYTVSKTGVIPTNMLVDHGTQIGAVIQMLLLSFALAWRINQEREQRQQAQAEALRVQQDANLKLEARVEERTEELRHAYDQLKQLSELDGLTQLKNRPYFDQALEREWRRSCRETHTMSLLMLDIDHFKAVNDDYGHLCGDDALRRIAAICEEGVGRVADTVARYGGEEFVILLPMTDLGGATLLAERIREAAASVEFEWEGNPIALSVSIGLACCIPDCQRDHEWLIRTADEALYQAKTRGRNRTVVARQNADGGIDMLTPESLQASADGSSPSA